MSVTNGQLANATNFNNAFMSRTAATTDTVAAVTVSSTTQSTDKDTGAIITQGGVGVEKNINAGGTIKTIDTTQSTDKDTGSIVTEGGVGIEKNLNVGGNVAAVGSISATGTMTASNLSGTNTGNITLSNIGSAPNAQGAALGGGTGQDLTLQPASASFGGVVSTTTQSFAGDKTFTNNVIVTGDLTVNGTTTTLNTATLDVEDTNIKVNFGGNDASSEGAGLTVNRTGTSGSFVYMDALASKFKLGSLGSESEVMSVGTTQTVTGVKTHTGNIIAEALLRGDLTDDGSTTGSNATITSITKVVHRLTNASLVSIDMIGSPASEQLVILINATGTTIMINHDTGATATNRIFTGTAATLTMVDDASIWLTYDSTESRWRVIGGSGSGSSSSSGINYILNPDAEGNTNGWNTFADAAATTPVDGTGGSPNVTWTRTTTTPHRGTGSFLFTKDAANRQGQGVSYDFTIANVDKGKVLQGYFEYSINSGAFADDDMSVWVYDITNALLIQPAPTLIKNSGLIERYGFEFQASISSTSYRLIIFVRSTSASAYTLKMDDFSVGPQAKLYGSPVTDIINFTPTGSWVSNVTYTGRWKKVGDVMEGEVYLDITGAPTATGLTINIPSGYAIDTAKLAHTGTVGDEQIGWGTALGPGANYPLSAKYNSTTSFSVRTLNASGTYAVDNQLSNTVPITFANGDKVQIFFRVPIVGWSSSVIISSDANTRLIAARVKNSATQSIPDTTATKVTFGNIEYDTTASYSSGTYTVPVPGKYAVSSSIQFESASWTNGEFANLLLYKNGSQYATLLHLDITNTTTIAALTLNGDTDVIAVAGDTLEIRAQHNQGAAVNLTASGTENYLTISKHDGPAQIAASETVIGSYTRSTTQSISDSTTTTLVWTTINFESGITMNTSTGFATVSVSGKYLVSSNLEIAQNTTGRRQYGVYKNGAQFKIVVNEAGASAATTNQILKFSPVVVSLLAGETISTSIFQTSGGALNAFPNGVDFSSLDIVRIGNY